MCKQMHAFAEDGRPVLIIRQDNSGENKKLIKRVQSSDWKLNIIFESMAKETPQQNSKVEVGFTTIAK